LIVTRAAAVYVFRPYVGKARLDDLDLEAEKFA